MQSLLDADGGGAYCHRHHEALMLSGHIDHLDGLIQTVQDWQRVSADWMPAELYAFGVEENRKLRESGASVREPTEAEELEYYQYDLRAIESALSELVGRQRARLYQLVGDQR